MTQYLIDTSIWVFFLRKQVGIGKRIEAAGRNNCFISEISLAELRFGAEKGSRTDESHRLIDELERDIQILPVYDALRIYSKEKARLQKQGNPISDFDLLIGATALANNLTLVTHNVREFSRIEALTIEDWTLKQV